jgi:hypothetical protein
LLAACARGHTRVAELLLAAGTTASGETVDWLQAVPYLALSVGHGFVEIVELLLKSGADPNKV